MIDRAGLAAFLRHRREALQPEDIGLRRGPRRRTNGLRREEVAARCNMSTDYYARLEQERGTHPSEQMIAAIAQGLHLTLDERDHLFRLAGHSPPSRGALSEHVSPGLALTGDATRYTGPARSLGFRWFTDPACRALYDPADHEFLGRMFSSGLREALTRHGAGSRAAHYTDLLLARSEELRTVWAAQEIGLRPKEFKRYVHPSVGALEVQCQTLLDPDPNHFLLVYTATPGTENYEKLQLLSVIGSAGPVG